MNYLVLYMPCLCTETTTYFIPLQFAEIESTLSRLGLHALVPLY